MDTRDLGSSGREVPGIAGAPLTWGLGDPRATGSIAAPRDVPRVLDTGGAGAPPRFDATTRDRVAALAARP